MLHEEVSDVGAFEDADVGLFHGLRGVHDGLLVKECMFAEEVLGSQHMENLLLSLARQLVYFHFSAVDDIEIVSRITRREDDLTFIIVSVYGFRENKIFLFRG